VPVVAAGGVADARDVRRLLSAGADAAVAGTRFLLSEESEAHPEYKRRVLEAEHTLVTLLFGVGWPMRHRVVPNAATDRWCSADDLAPTWLRGLGRATAPLGRVLPLGAVESMKAIQRPGVPVFSPGPPVGGMPDRSVHHSPLYAGESLHRMSDVVPAAEALARLTP
jgi:nitronate monooxygenase